EPAEVLLTPRAPHRLHLRDPRGRTRSDRDGGGAGVVWYPGCAGPAYRVRGTRSLRQPGGGGHHPDDRPAGHHQHRGDHRRPAHYRGPAAVCPLRRVSAALCDDGHGECAEYLTILRTPQWMILGRGRGMTDPCAVECCRCLLLYGLDA